MSADWDLNHQVVVSPIDDRVLEPLCGRQDCRIFTVNLRPTSLDACPDCLVLVQLDQEVVQ